MSGQTVFIISKDKDFSSVIAEQAKRELGLGCQVAETATKSVLASATLVVANEEIEAPCPLIVVENPPVRLSRLLDEMAAQLQKHTDESLALGKDYRLHPRQKQLTHASGKAVDLTDKETQLLQSLAEAESVAKDQLLKTVWGIEAALDTHTLETHIYRLRGKLRELNDEELIEAVDGGYRMKMK